MRDSFLLTVVTFVGASTSVSTAPIVTLGRGMWDFSLRLTSISDFILIGSRLAALQLKDPGGTVMDVLMHFGQANVQQVSVTSFRLLLPDDGWSFVLLSGATGPGQTHDDAGGVQGNRLI